MALRQQRAGDPLTPVVVMALRAAQVDLALPPRKQVAPAADERPEPLVARFRNRHAARLATDIYGERQQVVIFERQRRRLLMLGAAQVDALLEIDRAVVCRAEGWIARCDALHADGCVAVAV